ncbi:MAG: YihY/virulence factor BrkB family protein [Desulfobulbaceae bacterium]|nr:YihY/virulence factor BrkB family protein [Desulfobulbaceae bacterium]HIJ77718.1 YihY/virulence factor BrkB family protein [Deltaproteobacteria bacterium]
MADKLSIMATIKNGLQVRKQLARLHEWIWEYPSLDHPLWQRALRSFFRVHLIFFKEFDKDRITLRASALTFTIILSLVPTLALGTAVLKGLGAGNQARQAAYRLIDQLEIKNKVSPNETYTSEEQAEPPSAQANNLQTPKNATPQKEEMTGHLRRATKQIFDYVDRTNFATLGAFGIIGLLLAVVSVLDSIENSMNAIWLAESDRPWGRKIMDYLALMILLPVSINLALATEATFQSPALMAKFQQYLPMPGLEHLILKALPILLFVATFSTLYRFLPNTKVKLLPALAGGLFGGITWFIVQAFYVKLQIGVARYNAIYGSFATLPLFLIWLQVGWIIFLSGAEMAFAVQYWKNYNPSDTRLSPMARLALAFNIINKTLTDFKNRKITTRSNLAMELKLPETTINNVLSDLQQGGILRKVLGKQTGYLPAAPSENITPSEVVDLIFGTDVQPFKDSSLAIQAMHAMHNALEGKKINGS